MISVRGGMGLGDAIYVQAVARHLVGQGHRVEACTAWPDVFRPLGDKVVCSPFRRKPIDRLAHYASRRGAPGTTQFEDVCINAGIGKVADLRLDWEPVGGELPARLHSAGKPVIVVQMPRAPFGRSDGYGLEFLPDCRTIQRAIDMLAGRALLVQIGKGEPLFRFAGIDVDLANLTSVCDVLDVASAADGFLGYCSFMVPLAEALSKPALLVWSRKGLASRHEVVRQMTPQKILHRASSRFVMDDCPDAQLSEAVDALCDQIRSPLAA